MVSTGYAGFLYDNVMYTYYTLSLKWEAKSVTFIMHDRFFLVVVPELLAPVTGAECCVSSSPFAERGIRENSFNTRQSESRNIS